MKILITAGSTNVMIDKVRCISNIFKGRTFIISNKNGTDYITGCGRSDLPQRLYDTLSFIWEKS